MLLPSAPQSSCSKPQVSKTTKPTNRMTTTKQGMGTKVLAKKSTSNKTSLNTVAERSNPFVIARRRPASPPKSSIDQHISLRREPVTISSSPLQAFHGTQQQFDQEGITVTSMSVTTISRPSACKDSRVLPSMKKYYGSTHHDAMNGSRAFQMPATPTKSMSYAAPLMPDVAKRGQESVDGSNTLETTRNAHRKRIMLRESLEGAWKELPDGYEHDVPAHRRFSGVETLDLTNP